MSARDAAGRWDIAEIKRSYPLLEVVERSGVRLKRSGAHRWQSACPFHEDRNPSFFVDVQTERIVCFGCKVRGDVIDFVRLHEHVDTLSEACAWLAGTPPPVSTRSPVSSGVSTQRERRWDRLTLEQQLVLTPPELCTVMLSGVTRAPVPTSRGADSRIG